MTDDLIERFKPCDVGGNYWYPHLHGPAVYEEPCPNPATHRYRSPGMVDGHWQHRCAQHVGWLDTSICTIEPLSGSPTTAIPRSGPQ